MSLSLTANEPESDPKRSEGGKRKENKCGLEPVQPSAIGSSLLSQTCLKVMKPILNKERMILPVPWKNDAAKNPKGPLRTALQFFFSFREYP